MGNLIGCGVYAGASTEDILLRQMHARSQTKELQGVQIMRWLNLQREYNKTSGDF